jgi:hypothetical protein
VDPITAQSGAVISKPPQVTFESHVVSPPNTIYLSATMRAVVVYFSNVAATPISIIFRILRPDGTITIITRKVFAAAGLAVQTEDIPLTEGFLVNVTVTATQSGFAAQTFVAAYLEYASSSQADILQILFQGTIHQGRYLSWPVPPTDQFIAGQGSLRTIIGTNPAAGAEISETVPANTRWRLISLHANLTTSAVVANRVVHVQLDDGANLFFQSDPNENQPASSLFGYNFTSGPLLNSALSQQVMLPLPLTPLLGPGYRIRTLTAALDGGDDWNAPVYLVEEWLGVA